MSLAETERHTRTHKQARPIFDSGRDNKNKQGQREEVNIQEVKVVKNIPICSKRE